MRLPKGSQAYKVTANMHRFLTLLLTFTLWASASFAGTVSLLLDTELQSWLEDLLQPLVTASNAPSSTVNIHLVASPAVNAFATNGQNMYINTGLILRANSPAEIQGVIAHELGHIMAQHYFRTMDTINESRIANIAGAVLGIGAALAGSPQGAMATFAAGQAYGMSNFLRHSRSQEREADLYAVQLFHKSKLSVNGMAEFFRKLNNDMLMAYKAPPAHLLTHPLPAERLNNLTYQAKIEPSAFKKTTELEQAKFKRIKAKIYAFSNTPSQTLRYYRKAELPDRIAQHIAYTYQGKLGKAEKRLQPLLKEFPQDPYLWELAGNLELEKGNLEKSEVYFKKALGLADNAPLIRFHYGRILQAQEKYSPALSQFLSVRQRLPQWAMIWYYLGVTHGKLNQLGESHIALATYYMLKNQKIEAKEQLKLAKKYIKNNKKLTAKYEELLEALEK